MFIVSGPGTLVLKCPVWGLEDLRDAHVPLAKLPFVGSRLSREDERKDFASSTLQCPGAPNHT